MKIYLNLVAHFHFVQTVNERFRVMSFSSRLTSHSGVSVTDANVQRVRHSPQFFQETDMT